jgi:GLPGLI family protein
MSLLLVIITLSGNAQESNQKQLQITYQDLSEKRLKNIKETKIELVCTHEFCLTTELQRYENHAYSLKTKEMSITMETHEYHLFKDYVKNKLFYHEPSYGESFVEEEMNLFQWQIQKESKEILGYKCMKAICHFRGRDYEAWFTTDLPFKAAPWKFHGLPGVLLNVKSLDNFLCMEAIEIKVTKGETPQNPFAKEEFISYEEYKQRYISQHKKFEEKMKAESAKRGFKHVSPRLPRAEIIVKENAITREEFMKNFEE